jgi:hypothetical protein
MRTTTRTTTRTLGLAAVLSAAGLVAAAGASANPPTTVTGHFTDSVQYDHCTVGTPPSPADLTGDWSVTLHGPSAKGNFRILVNDVVHVDYKFGGMKEGPNSTPSNFVVYGKTLAGLLTVRVNGTDMTYTIAPYSFDGLTCDSVTFPGFVTE